MEARDMVLSVLEERFGPVDMEISDKIKAVESREILEILFRNAVKVKDTEEFGNILGRVDIS